jgi:hypothetical protein
MIASVSAQEQLAVLMAKSMPQEVLKFKFDNATQERIFLLTQKKKDDTISLVEREELEKYLTYDLLIGLAKVRAFQNAKNQ